jgi:hypothetical protein
MNIAHRSLEINGTVQVFGHDSNPQGYLFNELLVKGARGSFSVLYVKFRG